MILGSSSAVFGQTAVELPSATDARSVNDRTVGIVFHYEDIYRQYVDDFSAAFADQADEASAELRVVPMLGKNHVQTMLDLLYMKGVDMGIVHSDVFEYMSRVRGYEQIGRRINSIGELFDEKVAVIAGDQYESLEDLAGRRVNFRTRGKGSDVTGTILFDTLGIDVEVTRFDKLEALEKVKAGDIAAMVYLIEEPVEEFQALSPADQVRVIEIPQDDALLQFYRKAELTAEEFPELAGDTGSVPTLAVPVILAAYNWPADNNTRYRKSERFITALVDSIDGLKEGDTAERWQDVDLDREVPGTTRLGLVDSVLRQRESEQERLASEASDREAADLRERQAALSERLEAQLDQRIADTSNPAELDRLLMQLEDMLEQQE